MDSIRVAKVEGVICTKATGSGPGTLHLTAHHLIFRHEDDKLGEMWVPYPLISLVTRLPQTLHGKCPLTIRTRTFEYISLAFDGEIDSIDVFDSIKELTVATSVERLYAFSYIPSPPLPSNNGWSIYSPREEFGRMGVGSRTKAWRFTDINKDYSFSSTYPARMVVPTRISDTTLQYASKYRSKCRIPVLTYLHRTNYGSITRSSQPMVGLTANRSIQDEKLIEAIFQTHHSPEARVSLNVYGATTTNMIIDARPTTNAMANTAKGAGTENMDHYKDAKKAYLGIDNIHTMRESLAKVVEALRGVQIQGSDGRTYEDPGVSEGEGILTMLDRDALRRSGWLKHISAILEGTALIVRNVHINSSHVLIHCSDGWDRTSQLSAMSQLCLDPFYRTMRGFQILIEKDWVSFGHRFLDRCGHLSSEKFFLAPVDTGSSGGGGAEAAHAFFASVQNKFTSPHHLKETSPVFHQFLESVRQVQRQFPERFEFNERYLQQLYYHLYSCQFGTFLFNSEKERRVDEGGGKPPCDLTASVWDWFNSPSEVEKNRNPDYDPSLDNLDRRDPKPDLGVLIPNPRDVRFWHELYGRTDEEMNGRFVGMQAQGADLFGPVEGDDDDPMFLGSTPSKVPLPPSPAASPSPALARLNAAVSSAVSGQRSVSPSPIVSSENRTENLRAAPSTQSGFFLQPQGSGSRSPSPLFRTNPDTSSGGVKSIWGRLSNNASAAISAVQGAYEGVSKDFKTMSLGRGGGDDQREGELRNRDELGQWGEESEGFSSRPVDYGSNLIGTMSTNPWATVKAGLPLSSSALDNPWSSVRDNSPRLASLSQVDFSYQGPGGLPHDPSVATPPIRISRALSSPSTSPGGVRNSVTMAQGDASSSPTSSNKNIDPLGVGW